MQRAVFETSHDKLYRDATLRDGKLVRQRTNHRTCRFERRRYFFTPIGLPLFQVIEHSDANGKRAVFLDNMRVKARETKTMLTLEKVHLPAPAKSSRVHRTGALSVCFYDRFASFFCCLSLQPPKQEPMLDLER
jgi:hypothetical protein